MDLHYRSSHNCSVNRQTTLNLQLASRFFLEKKIKLIQQHFNHHSLNEDMQSSYLVALFHTLMSYVSKSEENNGLRRGNILNIHCMRHFFRLESDVFLQVFKKPIISACFYGFLFPYIFSSLWKNVFLMYWSLYTFFFHYNYFRHL